MAGSTNFPGSVDDFAAASPPYTGDSDSTGRTHSERHDDMEAAMMAVQTRLLTPVDWTKRLDNSPMSSLTGWTVRSGSSWAGGGTYGASQTDGGNHLWLEWDTALDTFRCMQATIRVPSGGAAGIGFSDSGGWGSGSGSFGIAIVSGELWWDRYGNGGGTTSASVTANTDHVFKVFENPLASGTFEAYVDDVLVDSVTASGSVGLGSIGLYSYSLSGGTAWWRNITIWDAPPPTSNLGPS